MRIVLLLFVCAFATFGQSNSGSPILPQVEKNFTPTLDRPYALEKFVEAKPAVVADSLTSPREKEPVIRPMKKRPLPAYRVAVLKRPFGVAEKNGGKALNFAAQHNPCSFDEGCADRQKDGGSKVQKIQNHN
jgi:hypothetical protein